MLLLAATWSLTVKRSKIRESLKAASALAGGRLCRALASAGAGLGGGAGRQQAQQALRCFHCAFDPLQEPDAAF